MVQTMVGREARMNGEETQDNGLDAGGRKGGMRDEGR